MEELVTAGLTRAIGVSNLTAVLLHDVLTYAKIRPVVNQIELHPLLHQSALLVCAVYVSVLQSILILSILSRTARRKASWFVLNLHGTQCMLIVR